MEYFSKRVCVLRGIRNGFTADGKPFSGLVRIQKIGNDILVNLSLINAAPLAEGNYVCILCDSKGKSEHFLAAEGVTDFSIKSAFDPSEGFCAMICFTKPNTSVIATGQSGNGNYNLNALLSILSTPQPEKENFSTKRNKPPLQADNKKIVEEKIKQNEVSYNDEAIADENYYEEKSKNDVCSGNENENATDTSEKKAKAGDTASKNENAEKLLHPFALPKGDNYYQRVKDELEEIFNSYPKDDTLKSSFPHSRWASVPTGENKCLVGAVYENLQVKYICYAVPASSSSTPPAEMQGMACFVPVSPFYPDGEGYYVLFQDASTGACLKMQTA